MCSSSCRTSDPRSPCHCGCRGRNHGRWFRRPRSQSRFRRPQARFVYHETTLPRRPPPVRRAEPRTVRPSLGRRALQTAVIGVSCAAFPGACPAIVGLGKALHVFSTARTIVSQSRSAGGISTQNATSLARYLAEEASRHFIGPWTKLVAGGIASQILPGSLGRERIGSIVRSTVSDVMKDGFDGLASWGVGN
jgi:hypothetical protein